MNGTRAITQTFNAANQVDGLTYDAAGNLTDGGTTTYGYDALNRMIGSSSTMYTYNGDGVLVFDGTTRYTQDLAAPLSQVVQTTQGATTTNYLYGLDRLAAVVGSTRTWYGADALGSVRQTLSDAGAPLGIVNYDPWGTPESGSVPTFGFTGELQNAGTGLVNLRARWYSTSQGTLTSRDPFAGMPETPYSLHQYAYGYSDPVLNRDPSGRCSLTWNDIADCVVQPGAQETVVAAGSTVGCVASGVCAVAVVAGVAVIVLISACTGGYICPPLAGPLPALPPVPAPGPLPPDAQPQPLPSGHPIPTTMPATPVPAPAPVSEPAPESEATPTVLPAPVPVPNACPTPLQPT